MDKYTDKKTETWKTKEQLCKMKDDLDWRRKIKQICD